MRTDSDLCADRNPLAPLLSLALRERREGFCGGIPDVPDGIVHGVEGGGASADFVLHFQRGPVDRHRHGRIAGIDDAEGPVPVDQGLEPFEGSDEKYTKGLG